jgi:nitroimidazol reductase NimA-like FMN-containing flavoprotein (pyridoxamine 5'-phosphate oxidase superfamily)
MRRKKQEITDKNEIEAIIRKSLVCRLGLADEGRPYIVPLCFGYQDDTLYFHSAREGKKLDILKKNNKVCFEFDINTEIQKKKDACDWGIEYKSVIGFGEASFVRDPEAKKKALDIIMGQYGEGTFEFPDATVKKIAVIKVLITSITGKRSS